MRKTGNYEILGDTKYFIPDSLPPKDPSFLLDNELLDLYGEAMLQLGKMNEMIEAVPDVKRFIRSYVVKEALLSSSIEGIHTTMLDVFTQPLLESKPEKATQLVMNYTRALYTAVDMIKNQGLPISSRVILKAHEELMQVGDGENANPGHYRRCNVKVGGLVPPPFKQVPDLMSALEEYVNAEGSLPYLINAGLAHVQFETIHPFMDGNGRIGRMLIILMLVNEGLLSEPILYPSYYFKKYHHEYYRMLDRVRTEGDFEGWIKFYLKAIRDSCKDAYRRAEDIEKLWHSLSGQIEEDLAVTSRENKGQALSVIFASPIISIKDLSSKIDVSYNTANKIVSDFMKRGILEKETQQKRGKLFSFKEYLEILQKDYEG